MELQNFVLLDNTFSPCGTYKGFSGVDSHGKFVVFPPEVYGIISAANYVETQSGKVIQFCEQDSVVIDNVRYLRLYYK